MTRTIVVIAKWPNAELSHRRLAAWIATAAATAVGDLILPSKPFVVFVSIGLTSGEVDEHLPA
jgi:predicted cobalt transporter CbtA